MVAYSGKYYQLVALITMVRMKQVRGSKAAQWCFTHRQNQKGNNALAKRADIKGVS